MQEHLPADAIPLDITLADAVFDGVVQDPLTYGPHALRLVERARRDGPVEVLIVALRAQAWVERLAAHNASAKAVLDEAVRLAEKHGLERRLGELLVSRVAVLHELGRLSAAQHDVDRAAGLLPATERSDLVFQQGALLQNIGRLSGASEHYRQVLADPDCPPLVRAKAGNNLAHLQSELGHTEAALALLDEAGRLAVDLGPIPIAFVAQTRAWVQMQSGQLTQSLTGFTDARRLYEVAGLPLGEHYLEYSDALSGLRLLPEAMEAALRGVEELPEDEVSLMAAEAQLRVARLSLLAGDMVAAVVAADHAASLLRRQRRPGFFARAAVVGFEVRALEGPLSAPGLRALRRCAAVLERSGMRSDAVEAHLLAGRLAAAAGQRAAAAKSLRSADHLSRGAPVLVRLRGRVAKALLSEAAGEPRAVLGACRAGLADLDRHRRALPSMELRVLASAHGAELGALGLRALLPTGPGPARPRPRDSTPARVFGWLERTRAAALAPLEALPDVGAERELTALRALHAELSALRREGGAEPIALLGRVAAAEAAVRRASWSVPAPAPDPAPDRVSDPSAPFRPGPGAPGAAAVREQLDETFLVEYGVLDGRLLATVLDRKRTRLVELGPVDGLATTIDSLLFALRRLSRPGASAVAISAARRSIQAARDTLADRILGPLAVDPAAPLVVVPVGDLQRTPWAPLHAGPVTVVPSARVWLRTLQQRPTAPQVALIAGPDLPGAAREVALLCELHPSATVLVAPDSTCEAAVRALRGAGLAHFACHGRLRADSPAFSALLLADGPLTVHELSRRDGAPGRVILAACESGAQVGFPGDEALGFVSALLARGSAGVVASGVLVPDEQTLPLMCELHARLAAGATLSGALWTARQVLDVEDPAQLATWCAFDAYGAA